MFKMKRKILKTKLRLPCFFAKVEKLEEEFESGVSDGPDRDAALPQIDHKPNLMIDSTDGNTALDQIKKKQRR